MVREIAPRTARALAIRAEPQAQLDDWHRGQRGRPHDATACRSFLEEIGHIVRVGADFSIDNERIDPYIAEIAGSQLVVPVSNARYSPNAANARWGSLYDAVYGTVLSRNPMTPGRRSGGRPARRLPDDIFPLASGSRPDAGGYSISGSGSLEVILDQATTVLTQPACADRLYGRAQRSRQPAALQPRARRHP